MSAETKPDGKFTTLEVRFVIGKDLTEVWVYIYVDENCPEFVHGWHKKSFPTSLSVPDLWHAMLTSDMPILWPRDKPQSFDHDGTTHSIYERPRP